MGQYYYFIHQNGQQNQKPLPINFNCCWAKNFENVSNEEKIKIFKYVSNINDWETGKIYAQGDYGRRYVYYPEKMLVEEKYSDDDSECGDSECDN